MRQTRWSWGGTIGGLLVLAWLSMLAGSAGCGAVKAVGILTAPHSEKIVPEYAGLPGKKLLIYVWAPPETLWDYPKVRLDVAAHLSEYLKNNVKDLDVVDPLRVEARFEKSSSRELDPVEVAREFQADTVLHLSLYKFSTRDPGMAHYYRGRIAAAVTVYEIAKDDRPAHRVPMKDVEVAVPDDKRVGFPNIRPDQIRKATYEAFAVELGRKFHEYEHPLE